MRSRILGTREPIADLEELAKKAANDPIINRILRGKTQRHRPNVNPRSDARYLLDPSVLLEEQGYTLLQESPAGSEPLVAPSLARVLRMMVEEPRSRQVEPYYDAFNELVSLWEVTHYPSETQVREVYSDPERFRSLTRASERGSRALHGARWGRERILYAAIEIAVETAARSLVPRPWLLQDILYEQIALAHLLESPALCVTTSEPAFFNILRDLGATVIDEVADELGDFMDAAKELNRRWHGWKHEHTSLIKAIAIAVPTLAGAVEWVFVAYAPWMGFVPILVGGVIESILIASIDPP